MEQNQQRNEEIEIDLREIFSLLLSKAGIILLTGVIFGLAAIIGTKVFITPQYQSETKIYVLAKQNQDTLTNSDLQTSALLTKDYEELIKSRTVTENVITKMNLDLTHEQLIEKMAVSVQTDTRVVAIKVKDEDPYQARELANAIRDTAAEHIKSVMDIEAVNVVDEANIPDKKCSPSTMKNGMLAGILGCILVIGIVLVRYLMNDTIQTAEDVERYLGLSTLGSIPLEKNETKRKKKVHYKRR